jgi:hypothetical protein
MVIGPSCSTEGVPTSISGPFVGVSAVAVRDGAVLLGGAAVDIGAATSEGG